MRLLIVHANTRTHEPPQPHPVPVLALEGAVSPLGVGHGRFTGAQVRCRRSPKVLGAGTFRLLLANRLGPEDSAIRAVARRWHVSFRYASLRAPPRRYHLPRTAWKDVQVLSASRLEPLVPFPLPSPARFSRSIPEPGRASRRLHAGCRSVGIRTSSELIPEVGCRVGENRAKHCRHSLSVSAVSGFVPV